MTTDTSWIAVSAKVAEVGRGYNASIQLTTIEKLTATQVVTATNNRYRRGSTTPSGGLRAVGDGHLDLLPVTDRRVLDRLARGQLDRVQAEVDRQCRLFGGRQASAEDVEAILTAIEQGIADARARIASLGD